ncbi:MAG: translation initiation factor IF-3 [Clostridia bacterium]|nr:translation initiation factor IF-3 [Clostridia bacterium]
MFYVLYFYAESLDFPHFFTLNWRCLLISNKGDHQINEDIKAPEVRLIGAEGEQVGIVKIEEALKQANDAGYDLVMIAAQAQPPVCKIMDYGKFCFEQEKREKEAKKKQQVIEIKEIQLTCNIGDHDFETKAKHAIRFLQDGNKVKVVLKFKARREMFHTELGLEVVGRFQETCKEYGSADKKPVLEGRTITLILAPINNKK